MKAETFDEARVRHDAQDVIGDALAEAHFALGGRLTDDERAALQHCSMWGSDGYPVQRLGRKWTIDHAAMKGTPLYTTKRAAVASWEIMIAKWVRLSGLEAQERAVQERGGK